VSFLRPLRALAAVAVSAAMCIAAAPAMAQAFRVEDVPSIAEIARRSTRSIHDHRND
jgi:hypothetical protein